MMIIIRSIRSHPIKPSGKNKTNKQKQKQNEKKPHVCRHATSIMLVITVVGKMVQSATAVRLLLHIISLFFVPVVTGTSKTVTVHPTSVTSPSIPFHAVFPTVAAIDKTVVLGVGILSISSLYKRDDISQSVVDKIIYGVTAFIRFTSHTITIQIHTSFAPQNLYIYIERERETDRQTDRQGSLFPQGRKFGIKRFH